MTRNKTLGLFLIIIPICLLIVTLVSYAVATFVINSVTTADLEANTNGSEQLTELGEASVADSVSNVIRVVLGLLGVIAVLGIIVGTPVGIYFLAKKEGSEALLRFRAKPEFASLSDEQLLFINKVSWGAFFGSGIWALGNKLTAWALPYILLLVFGIANTIFVYFSFTQPQILEKVSSVYGILTLLAFPLGIASFAVWLLLFIKGREMAWLKGWPSFDEFKNRQSLMARVIAGVLILMIILEFALNFILMSKVTPLMENLNDANLEQLQQCMQNCIGEDNSIQKVTSCQDICLSAIQE